MKIRTLIKKAYEAENRLDGFCGQIVVESLSKYKKTREEDEEDYFIDSLGCFSQAGDGLVFTDTERANVPVSIIAHIIEEKGYFTFDDFEQNKI